MITGANVVAQVAQAPVYLDAALGDRTLSFLPLCHIAERMASVFNPLALGLVVHFPENSGTVFNDLREVEPQVVFAPPRFWEKLHSQVALFMRDAIAPARWVYERALADAKALATSRCCKAPVWPPHRARQERLAWPRWLSATCAASWAWRASRRRSPAPRRCRPTSCAGTWRWASSCARPSA